MSIDFHQWLARWLHILLPPLLVLVAAFGSVAHGQTTPRADTVEQTEQLVGVQAEVAKLRSYSGNKAEANRWQILWLHQYISERVIAASLEIDATIAQIDNEIASAQEVGSYLSDSRDRSVTRANLLGILVGGGLSAISAGLTFSSTLNKPAASVGIGAGTLSAGFGIAGIRAQSGKTARFDFNSNMLAELLGRPVLENSHYPPAIVGFLNELPLNHPEGLTRKEELIQTWIRVRRIDSLSSKDKIDRLTSEPSDQLKLTIDDLGDRAAMLQDVRARISYFKRDLGVLLESLPSVPVDAADGPRF